tara:strand:- start:64 stop:252 length:189 start_codon:yes stop_codon:yes gene_type:complete
MQSSQGEIAELMWVETKDINKINNIADYIVSSYNKYGSNKILELESTILEESQQKTTKPEKL